jgi:Methyltransferase domain
MKPKCYQRAIRKRMRRDWDERAKANARHYVATGKTEWSRSALFGRSNIQFHVNNGFDLSMFADNSFDFALSVIVFQHIPRKSIVKTIFGRRGASCALDHYSEKLCRCSSKLLFS